MQFKAPNEFIRQLPCRPADRRGQVQRQSRRPRGAEGPGEAARARAERHRSDRRRARQRRKERDPGLRRGAGQADRRENPAASAQDHGGSQRPGDVGDRLGIVLQPQLPAERIARCARQPGHAEAGHSRRDRRAEDPLHRPGAAECRLQPGGDRARRAVQDHRRDRRRLLDRRSDRTHRGQGSDRAAAHHQHAGALQHPRSAASPAEAAQGQQQTDPLRRAFGARAHGRPVRHAADLRHAARSGDRGAEQGRRRGGQAPTTPRRSSTWSRCSRTRTSTRGARRSRC